MKADMVRCSITLSGISWGDNWEELERKIVRALENELTCEYVDLQWDEYAGLQGKPNQGVNPSLSFQDDGK